MKKPEHACFVHCNWSWICCFWLPLGEFSHHSWTLVLPFFWSSSHSPMSEPEGNLASGKGLVGRGVEDTSCHLHEQNPDVRTRWWKMPALFLAFQTPRGRAALEQLGHFDVPVLKCPVWQPVTERDCQGHMLIFQSFGQAPSHTLQDPGACVYWVKISAWP